ncbi:MAG: site-2 protease family protein [Clostridia bacterium]|nr:site-2 protease family protein [Clostridia bacterium]
MTIKCKETKIKVSFFFALTLALIGISDKTNTTLLCLLAASLHELGHLIFLLACKEKPTEIIFTPFGIRIERRNNNSLSFKKEALSAFAGPLVNLILFIFFRGTYFAQINLTIAVLNLLPCEPLDGSKILENILKIKLPFIKAEKISLIISCITVFPVAVLGFIILFQSKYNFSLLFVSIYLIFFIALKKKNIPSAN